MGQALYRKHRSTSLSEIVGQEHITTALDNALKTGKISHAYLFTGPRGTGKTSIARILAHAVNDLEYSSDPHLDIIEIDAASNRRIDEIRDLRDKVYIAPTSAKYKVYIIDEVHMLTREAFNALLKTLEEPPEHVIFILATTDVHKLPETIVSRTQRYNFRPVEQTKVINHLKSIAKTEGIKIDEEALQLLAEHGEGSFRDSISMLDQVSNQAGKVTIEAVRAQLGIPPDSSITKLLATLHNGDTATLMNSLQQLAGAGYRAPAIAEQLARHIRGQLVDGVSVLPSELALDTLKRLLDVAAASSPERYLEIILLQVMADRMPSAPVPAVVVMPERPEPAPSPEPVEKRSKVAKKADTPAEPAPKPKTVSKTATSLNDENWTAVLAELKKQYNTVYGIVRMAKTDFSVPGAVTLGFVFPFHQKRINDTKNRKIVSDILQDISGQPVELIVTLVEAPGTGGNKGAVSTTASKQDGLNDITNVFGGGELL